nr:MAG TPA: hypothetical protein [Caudoviricetes sp.]
MIYTIFICNARLSKYSFYLRVILIKSFSCRIRNL